MAATSLHTSGSLLTRVDAILTPVANTASRDMSSISILGSSMFPGMNTARDLVRGARGSQGAVGGDGGHVCDGGFLDKIFDLLQVILVDT